MTGYRDLSLSFLKIGLFGFGGGYAILPFIRHEVVDANSWATSAEFTDMVAISQVTPGPILINAATYLGYSIGTGFWGSFIATVCVCTPPVILMWLVCRYFAKYKRHPRVVGALSTLRPLVIGLVAAAALSLLNKDNFADWKAVLIFIPVMAAVVREWVNPIALVALSGLVGWLIY